MRQEPSPSRQVRYDVGLLPVSTRVRLPRSYASLTKQMTRIQKQFRSQDAFITYDYEISLADTFK
jgi:hypothetical protein